MSHRFIHSSLIVLCTAVMLKAAVTPAGVFSDNMVLQRGIPVAVWGWALVGEKVTVVFNGQTVQTTAVDSSVSSYKGYWKVRLQSMVAGGPLDMTITGSSSATPISLKNILIGDVWICSGQSNMWYTIDGSYSAETSPEVQTLPPDNQPLTQIRLCRIGPAWANNPALDLQKTSQWTEAGGQISAPWQICTRQAARQFSLVGAVFGITIHKQESVPIGIILSAVGGSSIKSWMSPELSDTVVYRQCGNKPDTLIRQRTPVRYSTGANTETNGSLFSAMINPLVGFGIKGVIWWQGEEEGCDYHPVCYYTSGGFRQLIREWRSKWAQGNFPFIYVQLQQGLWCKTSAGNDVRDRQMQALSEPNTGMGICFDTCGGTHPGDRYLPAMRMVRAAREVAYGENIEGMGPVYSGMSIEGTSVRIRFTHTGSGLIKKAIHSSEGDNSLAVGALVLSSSKDSNAPFEIAGSDNIYYSADAVIDGNTVVVSSPSVSSPKNVTYGSDYLLPAKTPLYNAENLPASMFQTATWGGLGTTQTAVGDAAAIAAGRKNPDKRTVTVIGGRFTLSKEFSVMAPSADIYDIKGRLIGRAEMAPDGRIKKAAIATGDQLFLLQY